MARELILKLGKKITDRVDVKLGMTKLDENSPEYYGLASVVTDEMAELALAMKVRVPTTPAEIGKKVGKDPVYVEQLFDQMSMIGLLEYNWENADHHKQWTLPIFVPGSAELMNMNLQQVETHPEIAQFFERMSFLPLTKITCMVPPGGAGVGMHVIPVEKAIPATNESVDVEHISHWLKKYEDQLGVGYCSCRNAMRIQNPLGEDASIMRTVALPSMLAILARNNAYHNDAVKLYELAKVYLPKPGQTLPDEPKHLVLGTYGEHEDFFKMKGEIEAFLRGMNVPEARYTAEKHDPTFHPGRCARVDLGCFGQIHPLVARSYGIDGEIFAAELNFTALLSLQLPEKTYTPLPKYPAVTRDIAVVCGEAVTVAALSDCIRAAGGKLLRSVELFDIYRGKGIASGSKSAAFRLTLRADDRTLTDADSDGVVSAVLAALEKELNAKLR